MESDPTEPKFPQPVDEEVESYAPTCSSGGRREALTLRVIPTEVDRCHRFEEGLNDNVKLHIPTLRIMDFSQMVEAALNVERTERSETVERPEVRAPARAYGMRAREEQDMPDLIQGTFFLYDMPVHALVDPGSTYSYICIALPVERGAQIDETEQDILVTNPLSHSIVVNKVYKGCPLRIQGHEFLADLIELPFHEFDMILRMDWLSHHQVMVDFRLK
ncbi:uncharacterized protein LOC131172938 [Hevea brasiliensis]|uniref:uncharacterized protein LOC131172938 n=1 Tax=Hevea brasiliensis TaxID=3981 RepID=UPI0025DABAF2|nr:uncharacterized protein LOC131172938 [Hevea brasiliensis]